VRRPRSGFSLVELLVVIVLLGLMAGVATVSWHARLPRSQLNTSVRVLADRLLTARAEAIMRNQEFRVVYDLDDARYWISSPYSYNGGLAYEEEDRQVLFETRLQDGVQFEAVKLNGVDFTDGLVEVAFDPQGRATDHLVVLQHTVLETFYTVEVLALTGLIRFHYDEYFDREPPDPNDFN